MDENGFLVEDGSGLVGSNSYVSVETANDYYLLRAYTAWKDFPLEIKQAALIQSSLYIDTQYDWKGEREYEDQGLSFPRTGILNKKGEPVTGVPNAIKRATLELGKRVVTVDGETYTITELVPDIDVSGILKKTRNKFDAMEEEVIYMTPTEVGGVRPFPSIDAMIPKYLIRTDDSCGIIMTNILYPPLTNEGNCCGKTRHIK